MNLNYFLLFNLSKTFTCHKTTLLSIRNINSSAHLKSKAIINAGKNFNKLLGYSSKKKKYYVGSVVSETQILPVHKTKKVGSGKGNSLRVAVLNKLFMTQITELMATGTAASYISGLNIEISRVSMCSTFTQLNVFWLARGTENDKLIESRLLDISTSLRHELSQLRVMGEVPRIVFLKDKQFAKIVEVDKLLEKADFGDDYVPVSVPTCFKDDNTSKYFFKEEDRIHDETEEELPEMNQSTLNLRHDYILGKIQKSMERSKALHRQLPNLTSSDSEIENGKINLMTTKERKEGLESFLLQRKILREVNTKKQRQFVPEVILDDDADDDLFVNKYLDHLDKYNEQDYLEEDKYDK